MEPEQYKGGLSSDGTAFRGMQRQASGRNVQDAVEAALRPLGWKGKSILAGGRTDAGVHARGQVIAFDLAWKHSQAALLNALNAGLPTDVAAKSLSVAAADFHPRFDAKARCYEYRLFCQRLRAPLRERYAWRVWPAGKVARLQMAARGLRGGRKFVPLRSPL